MGSPAAHTLRKAERLSGKKDISRLFSEGKWGVCGHLRYCWAARSDGYVTAHKTGDGICDDRSAASLGTIPDSAREQGASAPNRLLVSVSKKFFKRAVKRNLLKRRMREAYRLQKELLDCSGVDFLLSWTSKEVGDWQTVRDEVATALTRIDKAVAKQRGAGSATDSGQSAAEQPAAEPDAPATQNDSEK